MTKRLYLDDAYLRECDARVVDAQEGRVVLDRTVLYAESGGQAPDHGALVWGGGVEARVVDSQVAGGGHVGDVVHTLEGPMPPVGTSVRVRLDWERRYGLMRHHTAAHVFAAAMRPYGAKFTGGQLYPDRGRFDAHFEAWDPEIPKKLETAVNAEISKGLDVRNYVVTREEFEKGDLLRTAENLLDPAITDVRITDIVGLDAQADGGTHVRNTREVGRVVVGKADNKGKGHRRISFQCGPA